MPTFDSTVRTYKLSGPENNAGLVRSDGKNSANFKGSEINTQGLSTYYCDTYLATALDYARTKIGRATTIKSGYRASSSGAGASPYSEHTFACAADIHPSNGWNSYSELFNVAFFLHDNASAYGIKGIGIYDYSADTTLSSDTRLADSFIHIDVGRGTASSSGREQRPARWYQWLRDGNASNTFSVYFLGSNISYFKSLQQGSGDPKRYLPSSVCAYGLVADLIGGSGGGTPGNYSPTFVDYPQRTKLLQRYLTYAGLYTGGIDGLYGSGTANGVKSFQSRNSLTADGIIAWNSGNTFPKMFPTLRGGDRESTNAAFSLNRNIRFLQSRLGISADGVFGSGTESAVRAIQGPGADGICGPATWQQFADRA